MDEMSPRRVIYSELLLQRIKDLGAEAKQQGRLAAYSAALATIHDHLQDRPLPLDDQEDAFGEPCFTLKHMRLRVCIVCIAPVAVNFGVSLAPQTIGHETFVGVYVMSVHLLG